MANSNVLTDPTASQAPAPESADLCAQQRITEELREAKALLQEVYADSGFRNLL